MNNNNSKTNLSHEKDSSGKIRVVYNDLLIDVSLAGLEKMFVQEESAFCEVAHARGGGKMELSGLSLRYTAMSLIGLTMQERLGNSSNLPLDKIADRLIKWNEQEISLGDRGLIVWVLSLRGDGRAGKIATDLIKQADKLTAEDYPFESMALGWVLTGLSIGIQKQIAGSELTETAERIYKLLMNNRNEKTGLFSLTASVRRKNIIVARRNGQLGSFASQVYPIIGIARYSKICNDPAILSIAEQGANMLCKLQGPEGQWWWIYHTETAKPVIKYPVYSVHQDAMGPMALLAVKQAGGKGDNYNSAIEKSLSWLGEHPELPNEKLIDKENSLVRRAIQRDEPVSTGGFGLGFCERVRMSMAGLRPGTDNRGFNKGYVCPECRPYHLGWILLAAAMADDPGGKLI